MNEENKVLEKIEDIYKEIMELAKLDPVAGSIFVEGFSLSMNLLEEVVNSKGRASVDVSEHLDIVHRVLGLDLKELVLNLVGTSGQNNNSSKEADAATLEFITSDLDDYEKFLAQNKAKEDLEFLSKSL